MATYVAFLRFKAGSNPLIAMQAFDRRKTFEHPPQARVLGEFWVLAASGDPQVVLAWEADDEGPGDYYEAAWGDIFDISISPATLPVTELPANLPGALAERLQDRPAGE